MAILPRGAQEVVGTARFETFLRRLLSVKGQVAPTVEPKLQAGIELLTPPWQLGEAALLAGWRGGQCFYQQAPAAGEHSLVMLLNPPASNQLLVVERCTIGDTGAAHVVWVEPDTWVSETQRSATSRLDTRGPTPVGPANNLVAQLWAGTAAPGAGIPASAYSGYARQLAGGVQLYVPGPWIISPGYCMKLGCATANQALYAGFTWWERAAEPSELVAQ